MDDAELMNDTLSDSTDRLCSASIRQHSPGTYFKTKSADSGVNMVIHHPCIELIEMSTDFMQDTMAYTNRHSRLWTGCTYGVYECLYYCIWKLYI